jgi:hypothetical protein
LLSGVFGVTDHDGAVYFSIRRPNGEQRLQTTAFLKSAPICLKFGTRGFSGSLITMAGFIFRYGVPTGNNGSKQRLQAKQRRFEKVLRFV